MTEKLVPSGDNADGCALIAPELDTMVICWMEDPNPPMAAVVPPIVAKHVIAIPVLSVPYETVPKSARGRMPPLEDGASAIHSAEERCAPLTFAEVLKEAPVVVSVIVTTKDRPLKLACAEMWSPGLMVSPLIMKEGCGKNSNHAKYVGAPF